MNSGNIIRVGNGEIYIQDEDKQGWHICVPSDTFELFECDPEKNIYCSKELCCIKGGECHETTCIEFAKKNEDIIDALCKVREGYPITKEEIEYGINIKTEER